MGESPGDVPLSISYCPVPKAPWLDPEGISGIAGNLPNPPCSHVPDRVPLLSLKGTALLFSGSSTRVARKQSKEAVARGP